MKCSRENQDTLLHELVHDTKRISSWLPDFRVVSWTNLCCIAVSPQHFIYFLTVYSLLGWSKYLAIVTFAECLKQFSFIEITSRDWGSLLTIKDIFIIPAPQCHILYREASLGWLESAAVQYYSDDQCSWVIIQHLLQWSWCDAGSRCNTVNFGPKNEEKIR